MIILPAPYWRHLIIHLSFSDVADQCDVVAFYYDASDLPPYALLQVNLRGFVKHYVHKFVETL